MVMAKVKIGGSWSGVLEVELDEWTVAMLREEVAKRSGCGGSQCLNLICAGRVLRDGDGSESLSELGVKNNAKILASKVSTDQEGKSVKDEFLAEEERSKKLFRLKAAATSIASRHADGSLPVENFNLELENQSGQKVQMGTETDQRAIMMGLMLHANAKTLLRRKQFKDALEVLTMGEEAFSLCDPKVIEMVDNVPILQIDMVWCYFMLGDISWLSEAGIRLKKAREGIEHAHGKESTRLRLLQGGCSPELALHLRMELLEGVVAYHSGQLQKSKDALTAAQAKFVQLEVPDEALSLLMSMGYKEREAKRALRLNKLDVGSAVDFLVEEKNKQAKMRQENLERQAEIMEQKRYGTTPLGKAVDIEKLKMLVSIGFEKSLVAEALRRNENDTERALDDLTNPETNSAIQNDIIERRWKRQCRRTTAAVKNLTTMGFPRAQVEEAARNFPNQEAALNHLLSQSRAAANPCVPENVVQESIGDAGKAEEGDVEMEDEETEESGGEGPSNYKAAEERDVEMEDELTEELYNADAYADYDIEVTREGEAIYEYLTLLNSTDKVQVTSSSSSHPH